MFTKKIIVGGILQVICIGTLYSVYCNIHSLPLANCKKDTKKATQYKHYASDTIDVSKDAILVIDNIYALSEASTIAGIAVYNYELNTYTNITAKSAQIHYKVPNAGAYKLYIIKTDHSFEDITHCVVVDYEMEPTDVEDDFIFLSY